MASSPERGSSAPVSEVDDDLPSLVLATLVILLLLLAALIWIAFCMAVHRTAGRMAMFKRQRRTQTIIAAAISRAVNDGTRDGSNHQTPQDPLPTYEEALNMEPVSIVGSLPHRPTTSQPSYPPAYAQRELKPGNRVLRIAPERPGTSSNVRPPPYDVSVASSSRPHLPSPPPPPSPSSASSCTLPSTPVSLSRVVPVYTLPRPTASEV